MVNLHESAVGSNVLCLIWPLDVSFAVVWRRVKEGEEPLLNRLLIDWGRNLSTFAPLTFPYWLYLCLSY